MEQVEEGFNSASAPLFNSAPVPLRKVMAGNGAERKADRMPL